MTIHADLFVLYNDTGIRYRPTKNPAVSYRCFKQERLRIRAPKYSKVISRHTKPCDQVKFRLCVCVCACVRARKLCKWWILTLLTDAARASDTPVKVYQTTRRNIPEDRLLQIRVCPKEPSKTRKTPERISGVRTEVRTGGILNLKQVCYPLNRNVRSFFTRN
jgi:hypothetical protein